MKWTSSSNIMNVNGTSANGGGATNGSGTSTVDRRQSIFYTNNTQETSKPLNSPPIVILDQKFNGISSKNAGINEIKAKEMTQTILLNGSHLLESSTDPIEMSPGQVPATSKVKSKQSFLRKRVQNIGVLDYELERKCREQQLSKVLRALLFVESKLRSEQMIIRKQLCEKDDVINRQMCTIRNLKRKYGDLEDEGDAVGEAAQFCPKCRKNYYLYESKSMAVQTSDGRDDSRDEELNHENSSIQSVEYMSSSEEADSFNSFLGARRSRKYTSKRSFKDYFNNKSTSSNARDVSSSERSFYSESNTTNKHDSDKENNLSESNYGSTGTESVYSNFINSMHGIKSPVLSPVKSILNDTFSSTSSKAFEETVIYGNAGLRNGEEMSHGKDIHESEQDCDASQKYTKDMEVKQGVEPSEDWYASNSDMEENGTENGFSKVYGQSAGNPVLDCVNQILLQGNNDDLNDKEDSPITPSRTPSTPRSKRVHFSNQNTIHSSSQIASRAPYPIMEQDETNVQHFHYDVPLHYTNDYEQLGSSNHYVDMESKVGSDDMGIEGILSDREMLKRGIKTPPALPPKPANLIRLQKQLCLRPARIVLRSPNSKGSPSTVTGDGSEPDYCSISDVKETKTVQIVAEIHKEDCNDYSSVNNENQVNSEEDGDSEELEESFEDVPKLPMVQEIVPPKKKDMNKFIGLDNYITKSPYKYQAIRSSLTNRQKIAQILAEITKTSPSNRTSSPCATTPTYDSPVNIPTVSPLSDQINDQDNNEHKSAFDWYIKETVSKRPSIIHEEPPEVNESDTCNNSGDKQSFDYSDSEKVERPSDPITQDPIFYSGDEAEDFRKGTHKQNSLFKNMIALAETPAKLKGDKNYQFFLENSGLSSKPILPRKKRVYYTGPFV